MSSRSARLPLPAPRHLLAAAAVVALAACADAPTDPTAPNVAASRAAESGAKDAKGAATTGAVYTQTNATGGNAVVAFHRAADGTLSPLGAFATGGTGIGGGVDPLQSQYSVLLSDDRRLLYAVDAGSDDVASFRVGADGALTLADRVPSGGHLPTSLAVHHRLLYVLDAGSGTLRGYRAAASGKLAPLPHAEATLPAGAGGAAIRFTADGQWLIASERAGGRLDVFPVLPNGRLGAPTATASHGLAPFGLDVTPAGDVVVSETAGAAPDGAASSYTIGASGALATVTGSLDTHGSAACWAIATSNGRFAFVANAGTGNVTSLSVSASGELDFLGTTSTGTGSAPLDLDVSTGDRFLYVLEGGSGQVGAFAIGADGTLTSIGSATAGAPASGLQGLAAY